MLAPGRCAVWWAPVDAVRPAHVDLLDPAELAKAARFRRDADRDRSLLAAAVLRLATSAVTGVAPSAVVVDRSCPTCDRPHGRPRLPGTGLWASVSHAGDWVAVALTAAGPVGVDVEKVADVDLDTLIPAVLAPDESAGVTGPDDFFVCWTRKESVLKATGEGLSVPMREVVVGPPDRPPALAQHPSRPGLRAQVHDLPPRDGHVAALTVLTASPVEVDEHDAALLAVE